MAWRSPRASRVPRARPRPPTAIRLIWIDAQGHESRVIEGAAALLAAGVPVVTEFWPYGLARAGAAGRAFGELIRSRFSAFYDLGDERPRRQPAAEVAALLARYPADPGTAFTDLLLVPPASPSE